MGEARNTGETQTSPLAALLPYHVIPGFLEPALIAALLDFARANEASFRPTRVVSGVDTSIWNSRTAYDLGALTEPLTGKLRAALPRLFEALGMAPFELAGIELELIAYNDGAFSEQHVDTVTRASKRSDRAISAVCYLHGEPKRFGGGALRFHPVIARDPVFADVEPVNGTLVAFPAFAPHEVLPVRCPSGAFMDSRFAVYVGFHRARGLP